MIDHTPFWYIFILACIVVLRAIAPLSIAYTAFLITSRPPLHWFLWPLQYWAVAETLFYGAFYIYRHYYLQSPAVHPGLPSIEQRRELADRCLFSIPDCEKYLSKWFHGASLKDIKRDNVKDFFRWAFLNTDTIDPAYDNELEEYVQQLEARIGKKFGAGRNENVTCYRLSIDNACILHRSLWWYFCVGVVDVITYSYLVFYRFHFHHPTWSHAFSTFPFRPYTMLSRHRSPVKNVTYWHRPHTSTNKLPVLFIHGVGVGLYPYVNFLAEMNQQNSTTGDVGILAVEMLHISSTIGRVALEKDEFNRQLLAVLNHHGYDKFVLVSHSFGTFTTTHLLQDPAISKRVSSVVMIDPVSILLHLPDVAINFMTRKPRTANEWQLWYFGSRDAGVAHTFSRHFFWSESILWKEDIARRRATIFLGERDLLVNTAHVYEYLLGSKEGGAFTDSNGSVRTEKAVAAAAHDDNHKSLNVIWCPDMDHGQLFDSKMWRLKLIKEVYSHATIKKQIT